MDEEAVTVALSQLADLLHRLLSRDDRPWTAETRAEAERLLGEVQSAPEAAVMVRVARFMLEMQQIHESGDIAGLDHLQVDIDQWPAMPGFGFTSAAFRAVAALRRGDDEALLRAVADTESELDGLEGAVLEWAAGQFRFSAAIVKFERTRSPEALDALRGMLAEPGLSGQDKAERLAAVGAAESLGDGREIDSAVEHLRAAVAATPPGAPLANILMMLGSAHGMRYSLHHDLADLDKAVETLVRARSLAGSPAHPNWALIGPMLTQAYRLSGRRAEASAAAVDALRGHAWNVLFQADTAAATSASRGAADAAILTARQLLAIGDPAGAARALDAGRGLVLFAATERRGLADRLAQQGYPDLAARWRAASARSANVPLELRREVLTRIAGIDLESAGPGNLPAFGRSARLLEPPDPHETRLALRALRLDALVYLLPGAAVVVPADAAPTWLALPGLGAEPASSPHPTPAAGRDLGPLDDPGDVGLWAWTAAIGPVLRLLGPGAEGLLRLALVPMGELSAVAWHAARYTVGGRVRYAVEHAVFTYCASARMLCDSAWQPPVPWAAEGLFVADPDTHGRHRDLPGARTEASAIRDTYYPSARYLGRLTNGSTAPDGPGELEEVVDWLGDRSGGPVLHLACHGTVRPAAGDSSYLLLHGGRTLSAERIVEGLTASGRDIGLVVLAACQSGVASRGGPDEAFSLATSLLTHGVRSVVSTQRNVPDEDTTAVMFLFHHFLHEGLPPLDALHATHLWLIDPDRPAPAGMPPHRPSQAWTAFVHSGH